MSYTPQMFGAASKKILINPNFSQPVESQVKVHNLGIIYTLFSYTLITVFKPNFLKVL
jgi:hypothetical protein